MAAECGVAVVDSSTIGAYVGAGTFGLAVLGIAWRGINKAANTSAVAAARWQKTEDKLDNIVEKVSELVKDKEKVHKELADQMREDRKATNERLTYLERKVWNRG